MSGRNRLSRNWFCQQKPNTAGCTHCFFCFLLSCKYMFFMVALWNRADHYIFMLLFVLSSFFLLFFPRLISAAGDWILPYLHTWCGLNANLRCRSDTCCTRLAGNTGRTKVAKNPSRHHHTTLSNYIFATKARIDKRKLVS